MKRQKLEKILKKRGCLLLREGSKHSVFFNSKNSRTTTVPRHNEVDDFLVKKILNDLGIEK